jgi:hypothetical protein
MYTSRKHIFTLFNHVAHQFKLTAENKVFLKGFSKLSFTKTEFNKKNAKQRQGIKFFSQVYGFIVALYLTNEFIVDFCPVRFHEYFKHFFFPIEKRLITKKQRYI